MLSNLTLFAVDACDKSGGFLGLKPWWHYLPKSSFGTGTDGACEIVKFNLIQGKSDIPLILLAIVDDLLRLAGLIAVGYVMYGGIRYITSQGDPESISKAQSTIQNALIGLVVTMVAVGFVSFVGGKLGST